MSTVCIGELYRANLHLQVELDQTRKDSAILRSLASELLYCFSDALTTISTSSFWLVVTDARLYAPVMAYGVFSSYTKYFLPLSLSSFMLTTSSGSMKSPVMYGPMELITPVRSPICVPRQ